MKRIIKKTVSILLVVFMIFGSVPLAGFVELEMLEFDCFDTKAVAISTGEKYVTYGDYICVLKNGEVKIYEADSSISGDVVIPYYLGGYPVTAIGGSAFYNCNKLTGVTIPGSVKTIENKAFKKCENLTSVKINIGVTDIGNEAFCSCTNLTDLIIGNSVTNIGDAAFAHCNFLTSITIGENVGKIGPGALSCGDSLVEIVVSENNPVFTSVDGILFSKDKTHLIQYPAGSTRTTYTIPDSVKMIGELAFVDCDSLTNVTIPDGVTSIGDKAFNHCSSLTSVTIPDSITSIGMAAFYYCFYLSRAYYPGTHKQWLSVSVGDYNEKLTDALVYDCNSERPYYGGDFRHNLTWKLYTDGELVIGGDGNMANWSSGSSVPWYIKSSKIKSVAISCRINNIGDYAFDNYEFLTDVYYEGTEEEWNDLSIGLNNDSLLSATIHYGCTLPCTHSTYISSITTPATCKVEGVKTYTCDFCNNSYIEAIPTIEHTLGSWVVLNSPSCSAEGKKNARCSVCGEFYASASIPRLNHKEGAWETLLEPTTEAEGKKVKKCAVCSEILAEEILAKLPIEAIRDSSVIKTPSTTTIKYRDSIILHADTSKIPVGGEIEWTASNGNFSYSTSADGATCTISPKKGGDTTFTVTIYNADGYAILIDEQTMTSKAGFFDKIGAFFRKLFGSTKTIPQLFKGIF